jgi:predicted nucleotidyltransferase
MLRTLNDIVTRLVEALSPQRIVLFGSRARGDERPGSDADLLVVADLPGRPEEREAYVSRLVSPRIIPLDLLVYTPEEYDRFLAQGGSFLRHILQEGRVLHEARDRRVA